MPVSIFHDLIVVPVFVNEAGPYPFILDTGSTRTVLFQNFSTEHDITQFGSETKNVHSLNVSQTRPVLQTTQFRIGDFDLGAILPIDAPRWEGEGNLAGILGTDLLKDYGVIIGRSDKQVTISTPDVFETLLAPSWNTIKFKSNPYDLKHPRGLLFVNVKIDSDVRIPAIFDTGSQMTMMNLSAANDYFKGFRISNGRRTWSHRGALTSEYINKFVPIPSFKIGRMKTTKAKVWVKDMTSLDIMNKRRRPLMIVGMDLMKDRDFAINFTRKRLYISGPNEVKAQNSANFSLAFHQSE